jgi:aryl-alcohol dehydrogenase-like predicted oxidoreductase
LTSNPIQTTAKLGLGTVQFGTDYAIAHDEPRPSATEVAGVLDEARTARIAVLDTACAYGESESLLGEFAPDTDFKIVTKFPAIRAPRILEHHANALGSHLEQSLRRLRRKSVYGLLAHHAPDLLAPGGERLFDAMAELKAKGVVEKIGVSVYAPAELEAVAEHFPLDLVQVPVNVLDQRFLACGRLEALAGRGVEVHARSAFLKGLLVIEPRRLPSHFDYAKPVLARFWKTAFARGSDPMTLALGFALTRVGVGTVVVGVTSRAQLAEIVAGSRRVAALGDIDFGAFAVDDATILNPARWPAFRA